MTKNPSEGIQIIAHCYASDEDTHDDETRRNGITIEPAAMYMDPIVSILLGPPWIFLS